MSSSPATPASRKNRPSLVVPVQPTASMSWSFFLTWMVPLAVWAVVSRWSADTAVGQFPVEPPPKKKYHQSHSSSSRGGSTTTAAAVPSATPILAAPVAAHWPTAYRGTWQRIQQRRPRWRHGADDNTNNNNSNQSVTASTTTTFNNNNNNNHPPTPATDPHRQAALDQIQQLKDQVDNNNNDDDNNDDKENNNNNIWNLLAYADAMRLYEVQFHDGGRFEPATIAAYQQALARIIIPPPSSHHLLPDESTTDAADAATATTTSTTTTLTDEMTLPYHQQSWPALYCAVTTALGKTYFMANMFQKSYDAYTACLTLGIPGAADYLDALNGRASTALVLGRYDQAAADYQRVIQNDNKHRYFPDAFTGLARIWEASNTETAHDWDNFLVPKLHALVQQYEHVAQQGDDDDAVQHAAAHGLRRFHHALFTYHDSQTKDTTQAWYHLQQAHRYKLRMLPPWRTGLEHFKVQQIAQIFQAGFWPPGVGSPTTVPIFIIGFPRSGSTLLERVLDAHPFIVGTGENSVLNSRLDDIRNQMVHVSTTAPHELTPLTKRLAEQVVDEMQQRWDRLKANTEEFRDRPVPLRLVDKMLTNYYNVGFIHMLYPQALILHVMREPMDTLFSAHKHEFPHGSLEYTADVTALTELYQAYRHVMEHWDRVLPGRVTHVRYEDMVHDMPGMARAIIAATGLPWDETVLDFHKKKHYVNTMSSTQVRKAVYTSGMKSWMRYASQLQPLVDQVGDLVETNIVTTLPGYHQRPEEGPEHSEL